MRLSILPDDPGYGPQAITCKVFLNDVRIDYAQTADEELGEILALKKLDGRFVESPADGRIETEILRGRVRIEL